MKHDHNATDLYLKWSAVLAAWITCEPKDRGAVKFTRAEPVKPVERYWTVSLEGKITGDPLKQYGMLSVCVLAATAEDAERIALEQENDPEVVTELKVLFTRPS